MCRQSGGQDAKVETVQRNAPKVGRNDPCPCGSGKKYKKCHGAGEGPPHGSGVPVGAGHAPVEK